MSNKRAQKAAFFMSRRDEFISNYGDSALSHARSMKAACDKLGNREEIDFWASVINFLENKELRKNADQ